MYRKIENYLILCEGKSEIAYIQHLNRYLNQNNYLFSFIPKYIGNGHFHPVRRKYQNTKKENPRQNNINIWVDKDTYTRNDNGDKEAYDNKGFDIPDFMFNTNNFEDFLVMHMPSDVVSKWQDLCRKKRHFEFPMQESEYLPLYRQCMFQEYEKGSIPISLTCDTIQEALANQKNTEVLFKSDFLDFLSNLIELHKK